MNDTTHDGLITSNTVDPVRSVAPGGPLSALHRWRKRGSKRLEAVFLILGALGSSAPHAWAQSAYGVRAPIRGTSVHPASTIAAPVIDESTGLDLVRAATFSDAAAGAARQASSPVPARGTSPFKRIPGLVSFEDEDGRVGLMAMGSAKYTAEDADPEALAMARRAARIRARAAAMALLTKELHGGDPARRRAILSRVTAREQDLFTSERTTKLDDDRIRSASARLIRSAQFYGEDDAGGKVEISLFLTGEAAFGNRYLTPNIRLASRLQFGEATSSAQAEARLGFLSLSGGQLVLCADEGRVALIGCGSAPIAGKGGLAAAKRKAKARAVSGFMELIQGGPSSARRRLDRREPEQARATKLFRESLPPRKDEAAIVKRIRAAMSSSDEIERLVVRSKGGKESPGAIELNYSDDANGWVTTVHILTVDLDIDIDPDIESTRKQ